MAGWIGEQIGRRINEWNEGFINDRGMNDKRMNNRRANDRGMNE